MGAVKGMRAVMAAWLLISTLTHADDSTPAVSVQPSLAPAIDRPAPLHHGWAQAVSIMRAPAYFPVPAGMVWPKQPTRLAPVMVPWPAPGPWAPFVLLWVPVPTAMPVPVDYGPLMRTPVAELPLPDVALQPAAPGDSTSVLEAAKPGRAYDVPAIEQAQSEAVASPSGAMTEPLVSVWAPGGMTAVDYGPVTPTPVVDLIALEQQMEAASAASRSPERTTPKASRKQVRRPSPTATPSTPAQSATPPVKRRMCWSNGVVAPCR